MGFKDFVEGGIASIVAGCSTHPLDLPNATSGESLTHNPNCCCATAPTALAFHPAATTHHNIHVPSHSHPPPPPRMGPIAVGVKLVQQEGLAALFSGVSM
ncbi:hypothetical protein ACH5RR_013263 [Cinchona calisaya]|uniref:Uncharacterized protein n=1 Tax=Cinchona calisaya TaxID=153742 RepID=A0ABD3A1R5_9GENT